MKSATMTNKKVLSLMGEIASAITKREGKKSQVSQGNALEIVSILVAFEAAAMKSDQYTSPINVIRLLAANRILSGELVANKLAKKKKK